MKYSPLHIRLPLRTPSSLKDTAQAILEQYPSTTGSTRCLEDALNALARCVGYRTFAELGPLSDIERCNCAPFIEIELRLRQRQREVLVLSELLPEAPMSEIFGLAEDLSLIDWDAVRSYSPVTGFRRFRRACPLARTYTAHKLKGQLPGWKRAK